jgi:hypothetical protein
METLNNKQETKKHLAPSLVAKFKANKKAKEDIFSLSGLCRYANSETGAKIVSQLAKELNINFEAKQVTVKFLKDNNPQSFFVNKDGQPKEKFSHYLIFNAICTHAKKQLNK